MGRNDDGVRAGLLLFTLKDYNLGRSNTFIGEALVPLSALPCVDSSQVHTVANTYLKMTTPGLDIGRFCLCICLKLFVDLIMKINYGKLMSKIN